jgi:hypothetical protein
MAAHGDDMGSGRREEGIVLWAIPGTAVVVSSGNINISETNFRFKPTDLILT